MTVDIGRIYDNKDNTDAIRILVDRVWPKRNHFEKNANLDCWLKTLPLLLSYDNGSNMILNFMVLLKKIRKRIA